MFLNCMRLQKVTLNICYIIASLAGVDANLDLKRNSHSETLLNADWLTLIRVLGGVRSSGQARMGFSIDKLNIVRAISISLAE